MKIAFYYSEKQKKATEKSHSVFVNGKEFTEQISSLEDSDEVPAKNNWNDSVLVHVEENLPLDEFFLEHYNSRRADSREVACKLSTKVF